MKNHFLLDTHVLLWFLNGDLRLTPKPKEIISNLQNKCYISIASIWEIAIKIQIGKLQLEFNLKDFREKLHEAKIEIPPLSYEHVLEILTLENHHRDPFDRIIIAQSKREELTLISKDENIKKYQAIKTLW